MHLQRSDAVTCGRAICRSALLSMRAPRGRRGGNASKDTPAAALVAEGHPANEPLPLQPPQRVLRRVVHLLLLLLRGGHKLILILMLTNS